MKKITILLGIIFLIPIHAQALACRYDDLAKYKKFASNVSATYDYQETEEDISFSITLTNLRPDFYLKDTKTGTVYTYQQEELTIPGYTSGQTVRYEIYSNQGNCQGELLYTIRIVLPSYNPFYRDEICTDIPEYSLCQKWSSHGLSYYEFVRKVTAYKESLNKPDIENPAPQETNSFFDKLFAFLGQYYYLVLIVIILGSGVTIYVIDKRSNTYS